MLCCIFFVLRLRLLVRITSWLIIKLHVPPAVWIRLRCPQTFMHLCGQTFKTPNTELFETTVNGFSPSGVRSTGAFLASSTLDRFHTFSSVRAFVLLGQTRPWILHSSNGASRRKMGLRLAKKQVLTECPLDLDHPAIASWLCKMSGPHPMDWRPVLQVQ